MNYPRIKGRNGIFPKFFLFCFFCFCVTLHIRACAHTHLKWCIKKTKKQKKAPLFLVVVDFGIIFYYFILMYKELTPH